LTFEGKKSLHMSITTLKLRGRSACTSSYCMRFIDLQSTSISKQQLFILFTG
jgi:hypothetical protein